MYFSFITLFIFPWERNLNVPSHPESSMKWKELCKMSCTEPSDFIYNMIRELRLVLYLSLIPPQHVAAIKGVTYQLPHRWIYRKESWQGPWQTMTVTGNGDQAPLTAGEPSSLCQHIAHRAEVIFPFYDLLYLASVLALETVSILGISCIFPDCHFPLPCALLNILQYIITSFDFSSFLWQWCGAVWTQSHFLSQTQSV